MEDKINRYIAKNGLNVKEIRSQPFLMADIHYEKKSDGWHILLYPRVSGTSIGNIYTLVALAQIKKRETKTIISIYKQLEEYSNENSLIEEELIGIYQAFDLADILNELLRDNYLELDDVRDFSSYLSGHYISIEVATQFLASLAALRNNGGQISIFYDELIKGKNYEMLKVIDVVEESLNKGLVLENLVFIQELLRKNKLELDAILQKIKLARDKAFGYRKIENLDYDIAISFAGEDRPIAAEIAKQLKEKGIRVFYDEYEKANLWGKDLYSHLTDVYSKRALFCLMIISEHYTNKQWTNLERKAAQSKAIKENIEYILPLKLDNTEIDGLLDTVGYLNFDNFDIDEIVELIMQKIKVSHQNKY